MDTNEHISLFDLQVDHESTSYLREAAKWAKFLAILGFIWCGIFVIWILSRMLPRSEFSYYSTGYALGYMVVYIVMVILFFFPCLYLFNFSRKMKVALQNNEQEQLNGALKDLKSSFRFMGIMAIVWLVLAILAFVAAALLTR